MATTSEEAPPVGGTATAPEHAILIVDDEGAVRSLFASVLRRNGFSVVEAGGGREALELISSRRISAVLLDSRMPEMDGVEVLRALRSRPATRTLPVIVVTGEGEVDRRVRALEAGADDYLAKPVSTAELVARVRAQLRGQAEWTRLLQEHMRERTDALSDLGRLRPGEDLEATAGRIANRLARVPQIGGVALILFDTDGVSVPVAAQGAFAGHLEVGRALPTALTRHLAERAASGPWVERAEHGAPLPGDRHIELLGGASSTAFAPLLAQDQLLGVLGTTDTTGESDPSRMLALTIDVAAVAAVLLLPQREDWGASASTRQRILTVIDEEAIHPVFQPIRRLDDLRAVSMEALTRFHDGTDPQTRFLEAAQAGCGDDLELATLEAALAAAHVLPDGIGLSLNVSPRLLISDAGLPHRLRDVGRPVTVELTEHDRIDDYQSVRQAIASLGEHVQLSIDDAGAGYASLTHVLALAPQLVKLDRTWVRRIDDDPARQALVAGLVHFAAMTGCALVAEGIETELELAVLRELGVTFGQGYLFGRPAPEPDLEIPSIS